MYIVENTNLKLTNEEVQKLFFAQRVIEKIYANTEYNSKLDQISNNILKEFKELFAHGYIKEIY